MRLLEIIVIAFFSLTPLFWLHGNELILGHDSGFRLNFVDHLKNLYFGWNPYVNFGVTWSLYHGFLMIQGVETFFSFLFSSIVIGQKLTFIFWFFAIGISMYVFVRHFFSESKYLPLRLIAPIGYMFNFYVLNAWAIAERAKFSLYIALPVIIVIFFKTMHKEWSIFKGGIFFGLLFFFFNGGGSPPLYGGILVTLGLLGAYFLCLNASQFGKRVIGTFLVFGFFFVVLNAYWIVPQIRLVADSYTGAVSARGGVEGLISWEREVSKHASILNIVRLQGFPDWYGNPEHPYANMYIENPLLGYLSFVPLGIIVIGGGLFGLRGTSTHLRLLVFLLLLGLVGLFFTAGSHPPFGAVYVYLMRHVPGFAIFRSSFYKFAPTVYLPIIIFSSYYLSEFLHRIKVKRYIYTALLFVIPLGMVSYHFPYFTGNFFFLKGGFSTRVEVPEYITEMTTALKKETDIHDRILLVPPLDSGFINSPIDTYTWGFYSLDVLPRINVNRSVLANDSNDDSVTRLLYKALASGDEETFLRLSKTAGVSHLLWRGDVKLSEGTQKKMSPSSWMEKILSFKSLIVLRDTAVWKLYTVTGEEPVPMVYAPDGADIVITGSSSDAYIVGSDEKERKSALLRASRDLQNMPALMGRHYVEAECFLCKHNEYEKLVEAIQLPPVRSYLLPILRNRQIRKEKQAIVASRGTPGEIDAILSASSSRLSEIIEKNFSDLEGVSQYRDYIAQVLVITTSLEGREKDFYSNRVLAYLDAHARELRKSSVSHDVLSFIQSSQKTVGQSVWMGDEKNYRFGFMALQDDEYIVWTHDDKAYASPIAIDGKTYRRNEKIKLTTGYHRLVMSPYDIQNTSDEIVAPVFVYGGQFEELLLPHISFVQKNPTRYEVVVSGARMPFVLVLNQRFDSGWKLVIDGIHEDYPHYEVNGFANAWVISKTGDFKLTLHHTSQQSVYAGGFITIASLVVTAGYYLARRRGRSA
jgi:hypothetical protein